MKRTTSVLLVLCLVAMFTVSAPAVAEEEVHEDEEDTDCVTIHLNGPGVSADPRCIMGIVTALVA